MTDFYTPVIKEPIKIYERRWRGDARGSLIEILRNDQEAFELRPEFGQAYVTTILPGVVKAWHMHKNQTDRMFLLKGTVLFGCVQWLEDFSVYETVLKLTVSDRDPRLILIPSNIYHGFKNIGKEEAYIINIPDLHYFPNQPDEHRKRSTYFEDLFSWDLSYDG